MDDNNLEQNLTSILSKFESDTSRLDFIEKTRYNLYASVALTLSCKYIFLGDTCTTIAARILSNVALGRGAHLPFDAVCILFTTYIFMFYMYITRLTFFSYII